MANRLELDGRVVRAPDIRYSPAAIPITRFVLEHRSRQVEAGLSREVYCRIGVVACGEDLAPKAKAFGTDDRVRVSGFIERTTNRQGEPRLVLHAVEIEPID